MSLGKRKRKLRRLAGGERGVVTMEFVILGPILLALLFGIVDFGHGFFIKQMVTNAAREAARYGVKYAETKPTEAQIRAKATDYLSTMGIPVTDPPVVTNPAGASGTPLSVVVKANKQWWILWMLTAPGMDIYGVSTMNHE